MSEKQKGDTYVFPEEIKRIIQCSFLTQQNFAKKMGVFFLL